MLIIFFYIYKNDKQPLTKKQRKASKRSTSKIKDKKRQYARG